ncbi:T6SS phospholipase effector Tle1-like catalytic domain-containing protein [Xanthomonas maliensis]|uniref:T6SS phospholipase effector Tle1-like catalytic domain-containing protein n=1 Tax=Xanthomonas maliensis TaxID=1321368 RepID=UPI001264C1BA|nr:DUF2235 domain-containing protein [Xanthomonas maliensis]KAB7772569.1 hypothetical protein CKY51_00195 [Xanthomonas maliensis]
MTDFKPGWYAVKRQQDGSVEAWLFQTKERVTMTALVLANGDQILYFRPTPQQPYLAKTWSSAYEWLPTADPNDHWDNDKYGAVADGKTEVPKSFSRSTRKPTPRELSQRAGKACTAAADGLSCTREIHVAIFFDGTNNNMKRDRPSKGHSNIVSLYDAHKEDRTEYFRFYVPGVGTKFPEIGEDGEDATGKSMAKGGENRIHWALIQLYNAVHTSVNNFDLLDEAETKDLVTGVFTGLSTWYRLGDGKMISIFRDIDQRLTKATADKRPTITKLHLSVFGFSRGAAEARTFSNWLTLATRGKVGSAQVNLRFLGIYDTVASVLLADSAPFGNGLFDWANKTMRIPEVEGALHYVAGHEIRRSFPLSTMRAGGSWPARSKEYVYPGAHSDIGGGYSPGDQGKARGGRSSLMSQIPLNDMYFEASNNGVKLRPFDEMVEQTKDDYKIDPSLEKAFAAYLEWSPPNEKGENLSGTKRGVMENRMEQQMQRYWRWRASRTEVAKFQAMQSYQHANTQDRTDLMEGNTDWQTDIKHARAASQPTPVTIYLDGFPNEVTLPAMASRTQRDLLAAIDDTAAIPAEVDRFFDEYVHDSHAGFWLLGPVSQFDKNVFANEIRKKNEQHTRLLKAAELAEASRNYRGALQARAMAERYELNQFEKRVLAQNPKPNDDSNPATIPLMSDKDAADLRDNAGVNGWIVRNLLGTATRREANGPGQYRRIFDRDHETLQFRDEALYLMDKYAEELGDGIKNAAESAQQAVSNVKERAQNAIGEVIDDATDAAGRAMRGAVEEGVKKIIPPMGPNLY